MNSDPYIHCVVELHSKLLFVDFFLCSYGFVDYPSVEAAKTVFDNHDNIMLDGHTLHINFSLRNQKGSKENA